MLERGLHRVELQQRPVDVDLDQVVAAVVQIQLNVGFVREREEARGVELGLHCRADVRGTEMWHERDGRRKVTGRGGIGEQHIEQQSDRAQNRDVVTERGQHLVEVQEPGELVHGRSGAAWRGKPGVELFRLRDCFCQSKVGFVQVSKELRDSGSSTALCAACVA